MFFSIKKQQLKDQAAGLIFPWRKFAPYRFLSTLLSVILAALFFSALLFGITVKTSEKSRKNVSTSLPQLYYISKNHPQLESLAQIQSNLPFSWNPEVIPLDYYFAAFQDEVVQLPQRALKLLKPEIEIKTAESPPLFHRDSLLPRLPSQRNRLASQSENKLNSLTLHLVFSDPILKQRAPEAKLNETVLVNPDDKGSTYIYSIIVSNSGKVIFCSPQGNRQNQTAENWIRSIQFQPTTQDTENLISTVTIQVVENK